MRDHEDEKLLITSVIRGETDVGELRELGVTVQDDGARHTIVSPGRLPVVEPSLEELAVGLYSHWARSSALQEWAQLILGGLFIDLTALEDRAHGEQVLEMISDAAAGVELSAPDLEVLKRLVESPDGI